MQTIKKSLPIYLAGAASAILLIALSWTALGTDDLLASLRVNAGNGNAAQTLESADQGNAKRDDPGFRQAVLLNASQAAGDHDHIEQTASPTMVSDKTEALLSSIEDTVFGVFDPASIIEGMTELASHPVDDRAILDGMDVPGTLRYSMQDSPDGVTSEFWVARSRNPAHPTVLSFRSSFAPTKEDYIVGSAARLSADVTVAVYLDENDRPSHLSIVTDLRPSSKTIDLGLSLEEGRIVKGLHYSLNLNDPTDYKVKSFGLENGARSKWKATPAWKGDLWPDIDAIEHFSAALLSLRKNARGEQ